MRPEIADPNPVPGAVGRFRPEQIAQRSTWRRVPDEQSALAAMHIIHVVPQNGVWVAAMNPLDPGTIADKSPDDDGMGSGWLARPHARGGV